MMFKLFGVFLISSFFMALTGNVYAITADDTSKLITFCKESSIQSAEYDPKKESFVVRFKPGNESFGPPILKLDKINNIPFPQPKAPTTPNCTLTVQNVFICSFYQIGWAQIAQLFPGQVNNKITDQELKKPFTLKDIDITYDITAKIPNTTETQACSKVSSQQSRKTNIQVNALLSNPNTLCTIFPPTPKTADDVSITAVNLESGQSYKAIISNKTTGDITSLPETATAKADKTATIFLNEPAKKLPAGDYSAWIYKVQDNSIQCSKDFQITPSATPCTDLKKCTLGGGDPCNDVRGPAMKTAIGCVHTNPAEFVKDIMTFIIGIGGGLAFLMMLLGTFQMLTSQGNPETLNAGRERLTSAVIGLLFIIFAVLFLQIIGVDILNIPGFGR